METVSPAILSVLISVFGTALTWLIADAKSKSRVEYINEKLEATNKDHESLLDFSQSKVSSLEQRIAKSEQDRGEIHRSIERLDSSKASKDIVDGFRTEINTLRLDMDKRFDKIERMLEKQ